MLIVTQIPKNVDHLPIITVFYHACFTTNFTNTIKYLYLKSQ